MGLPFASRLLALTLLLATTLALSAQPPGDPLKRPDPPKVEAKDKDKDTKPLVVKLPDGTFLWLGPDSSEKIQLTPPEYQKLLDRAEALKKELAARKPAPPSGCAVRGRVEKRGEQLVAALKLTYSFRTTQPNSAVALGGKKAFLVSAALDGAKLPVLDTAEDGFAVLIEAAGDHKLTLDVEAPVTARGAKEVGFDLGMPRAPITTLALDPPAADVRRVTIVTRAPDVRRVAVDVKQLTPKGPDTGFPLGPVESLELIWDPPAGAAGPVDQVQSAEFDVSATLTDGFIESVAKVKLRGPAREWKLVAPANADVSVDRAAGTATDAGPAQQPVVTKPTDNAKLVWKIELPAGSTAADWTITAVVRQQRPKVGAKSAASAVGPFAVLDVLRQTGLVKVTAGPHTRFVFKHGPDLRRAEVPGSDDEVSTALFRLATGPTGTTAVNAPLLSVEAWPIEGAVRVKPTYKLRLTEAGWLVRAEVAVKPIRTEVTALTIDVPAEWRGLESESDPDTVASVTQGKAEGAWRPVTVQLAAGFKQPFALVLVGTVPLAPNAREATVSLPRFPKSVERDATVTATVPDGLEVRGTARGWDGDQPAAWGAPLTGVPGPDGKVPKAVVAVSGKGERGLARVALAWQPYRPDIVTDIRSEVTIGERQLVVSQTIKLRSPDGLPKSVRFRGPPEALGLKANPPLDAPAPGVWSFAPPSEAKEATLKINFALPLPRADGPMSIPVGLFWPIETARAEAYVRVWVNSVAGRAVAAPAAGWRELPPEPDREAFPALTLSASAEHPLMLDIRPATPEAAAAVWVERALIEAGMAEDGSVSYRARFRLARWLTPAVEVVLPDAAGPNPTARVDGLSVALVPTGEGEKRFRVQLPDAALGRAAVLDVQYTLPGTRHALGETVYRPPQLIAAAHAGPTKWLVTEPADATPLLFSNRGRAELRWRARGPTFAPAAASRAGAERWFVTGNEPALDDIAPRTEGEPVVIRQTTPEPVRVVRVPWLALVVGASLLTFLVLLVPTWLPTTPSALLVVLTGGAFGVAAVLYPQPAAQIATAGEPGLVIGLLAVTVQTVVRWQVRRRVTNLPGFTRTPAPPSAVVPAPSVGTPSVRSRPASSGGGVPEPAPAPSGS